MTIMDMSFSMEHILVNRQHLAQTRSDQSDLPQLADGAVRLKVESFSLTANNITYAVLGDRFGYWNFFPAAGDMGIVPTWGHAVVEASNHDDVAVGERIYGFLPMGTHLDVVPGNIAAGGFADLSAHRQAMSPIYNHYSRLAHDPEHRLAHEVQRMVFGPLFKTGFLIEAMFRRKGLHGAQTMLITSASSKTSMSLASVAKDLSPTIVRVGLTSDKHVAFVESTGLYDRVIAYDQIASLPQTRMVCVDFAGNGALLHAIHSHLGDALAYSCLVGATHVSALGDGQAKTKTMPGPEPILFFAPDHAVAAVKTLGAKRFSEAVAVCWHPFLDAVGRSVTIEERAGLAAAGDTYLAILQGMSDPSRATVVRP